MCMCVVVVVVVVVVVAVWWWCVAPCFSRIAVSSQPRLIVPVST